MENFFEDPSGLKIRTNNCLFFNSDTLFVEYDDVIRNIQFLVLILINRMKEKFDNFLDLSPIYGLDPGPLMEWYMTRKNKNVLYDLLKEEKKESISYLELEILVNSLLESAGFEGLSIVSPLSFANVLKLVSKEDKNFLQHIKVWYPFDNEIIRNDIETNYDERVNFVYGELDVVLEGIPNNSTFVFSDVTNISILEELGKLEYSSIIVPSGYKYNETDGKLKIDIESYQKESVFKFNFFNNF